MIGETVTLELIGGSRDGEVLSATAAPEYLEVGATGQWVEVYERQTDEPPFIYVQIGYAQKEQWQ